MKFYDYWRSSAGYRLRIALNLKGLSVDRIPIGLRVGEHRKEGFLARNPAGLVPVLETDDGRTLTQSLAIVEWLEEVHPQPPLLPVDPELRARVRAVALLVACEIHPLNNLRVRRYLEDRFALAAEQRESWDRYWLAEGLSALETMLRPRLNGGPFCFGEKPGLADLCLVPQLYNARRFDCPLEAYPTLLEIDESCQALDAFQAARPEAQSDAVLG